MAHEVKVLGSRPPNEFDAYEPHSERENRLPPWPFGLNTCVNVGTALLSVINSYCAYSIS